MTVLELRIDAALGKGVVCVQPNYIIYDRGNLSEVLCKVCGVVIRKLLPVDDQGETVRINGRTIVRERLALACLPNYREALIHCADGSAHVTPICATCAPQLSDAGVREECYSIDLKQWSKEGVVSEALATRNPDSLDSVTEAPQ